MQRAGDFLAVHDALRQRAVLVRALVVQGEDLVVGSAEDGDVAAAGALDDARAELRDVVQLADQFPVAHGCSLVIVEIRLRA